jgi:hypothetical protein
MAKRIGKYKVSKKESIMSLADGGIANGNLTTAVGLAFGTQTVAAAGSDQDGAGAISATGPVVFVTGADNTKGVRLPALADVSVGQLVLVCNNLSNKTLEIYPASGDAINVLSDNGALTVAADTITLFIRMDDAEWFGAELPVVAA